MGPVALLLGDRRISAISARYEFFVRERSASALEKALADTVKELQDAIKPFGPSQIELETRMDSLLGKGWRTSIVAAMKTNMGTVEAMERVLLEEFRRAYVILIAAPEFAPLYNTALEKRIAVIKAQNKLLAEKLYRKALTIDYVHQRPADQPFLHQGRLVLSTPLGTKPETPGSLESAVPGGNLTFNGGLTFYGSTKAPGVKKLRDAQASAALDWSPRGWGAVRPTYTAAYYFQYMIENGVIEFDREAVTPGGAAIPLPKPAIEVLNTKGPIHVAQIRMSFPIGATGISFPLAFSYSSRTELITGRSFWQGHVGMTYDFSKLRTLLGAAAGGLLP